MIEYLKFLSYNEAHGFMISESQIHVGVTLSYGEEGNEAYYEEFIRLQKKRISNGDMIEEWRLFLDEKFK